MPSSLPSLALFHERDDADRVALGLRGNGFDATVSRARFHGEDDDEDQPWQVVTDAPELMLELLCEEHDGWIDHPEPPARAPLDLPAAPRRLHRPDGGGA